MDIDIFEKKYMLQITKTQTNTQTKAKQDRARQDKTRQHSNKKKVSPGFEK